VFECFHARGRCLHSFLLKGKAMAERGIIPIFIRC